MGKRENKNNKSQIEPEVNVYETVGDFGVYETVQEFTAQNETEGRRFWKGQISVQNLTTKCFV